MEFWFLDTFLQKGVRVFSGEEIAHAVERGVMLTVERGAVAMIGQRFGRLCDEEEGEMEIKSSIGTWRGT